jgi:Leucine-rich repeat (LRR) protein
VLASRREKVVFRQVEVGRETILLRFLVQDSVGIAAGNGISGTWRGYFSGSLREGLLVLDKTTYRPVRTDLGDVHESFAQYMDLGDGRFAPLAIQIEQGGTTWDWKFRIYQPGLWLLAESRQRDWEGRGEPLVIVDQVKVNGQPAVPMAQDRAPTKPKPPTEASRADDWGPAVDGVQCRLEGKKPTWKAAEMPTLRAYVRHQAETRLFLSNHPMFGAQLEVDGHWHRWNGSLEWAGPAHSSSKFRTKDEQPLAITLDENWQQVENKQRLRMDPGRHVVRFAWEGHPERAPREGPDEQRSVVLMSNPVRITILPERPQPKPADLHPDERAAAAALQQLGAILAAGDQGRIRSVRLSRTAVTDADLLHLKKLSGLKALYLDDTRITDAGLAHLAGLTGLETLSLNYTRIGDAGLEHLKTLSQLRSLELLETAVTAAGLRSLRKALPALQARVDPLKLSGLGDLRAWRNSAELNDDYELLSVDLLDANITDTALERLKDRRSLQDVCLFNTPITDAGLAHLQGLTDLHTLYLSNTRVTDAGLAYVEGMKKLKSLLLADTRVGDAGLRHLEGLSQLEFLRLSGTLVSDAGLAHLSALTNLTGLDLSNCQVSGAGLGHLRALTKLTSLALSGTAVADPGLIHVQPFENLELLYLSHTSVTDAGLEYLTGLKKLRGLEIEHTAVTDEGVKRLKLFLPNASIYR